MYTLLFCFWLLLCGRVTSEILLIGIAIEIGLYFLLKKLFGYTLAGEIRILRKLPVLFVYFWVLLWEILKAGYCMCRDILFKNYKVTPTLVTFETDLKTDLGKFLLANSITLTPGTITIRVEGSSITVHCLDRAMLDTSENGVFQRWLRRLED